MSYAKTLTDDDTGNQVNQSSKLAVLFSSFYSTQAEVANRHTHP